MSGTQAIDGKRKSNFLIENPYDVLLIGDDTDDGPEHELFDETVKDPPSVWSWIVDSFKRVGQENAVVVRKNGDKMECVAGRCRVKAARVLFDEGYPFKLEVTHKKFEKPADAFDAMVAENVDRKEVSVLQKAQWALRMQKQFNYDDSDIAVRLRLTPARVTQLLSFFDCAPEVQKAVKSGEAAFDVCPALAKLDRKAQVAELKSLQSNGEKVSARNAAQRVRAVKNGGASGDDTPSISNRIVRKLALDAQRLSREELDLPIELKGKMTTEEAFVLGLRVAIHDVQPSIVKGLTGWIRDVENKKKTKKESADAKH